MCVLSMGCLILQTSELLALTFLIDFWDNFIFNIFVRNNTEGSRVPYLVCPSGNNLQNTASQVLSIQATDLIQVSRVSVVLVYVCCSAVSLYVDALVFSSSWLRGFLFLKHTSIPIPNSSKSLICSLFLSFCYFNSVINGIIQYVKSWIGLHIYYHHQMHNRELLETTCFNSCLVYSLEDFMVSV